MSEPYKHFDVEMSFGKFMKSIYPNVPEVSSQYLESKKVWFAGISEALTFLTQEIPKLDEEQAIKRLDDIGNQIQTYFKYKVGQQNN